MNTIGQREALSRTGTPTGPSAMARSRPDGEYNLASYAYDAQSRLISRSVGVSPTTTTAYIHDGWNRIAEYEINNQNSTIVIRKSSLWGLDMSGAFQGAGGVGGLLSVNTIGGSVHYPTFEGNGNITEYLTAAGAVAAHFEYDPFGNVVASTDATNQFEYRFSTKPIDPATGLFYYGYRWFDPLTGRWPSRDPIGEEGGVNLYGFVGNDGADLVDFLGHMPGFGYSSKAEAIEAAAIDVWSLTETSVQKGRSELELEHSEKTKSRLWNTIREVELSRGENHLQVWDGANRITIYGVEYGAYVCCDEVSHLWSYGIPIRGRLPTFEEAVLPGMTTYGFTPTGGPGVERANKGCSFVHSHNIIVDTWIVKDNKVVSGTISGDLSGPDKGLGARTGIDIIAVSDDNFWDYVVSDIPRAIPVEE